MELQDHMGTLVLIFWALHTIFQSWVKQQPYKQWVKVSLSSHPHQNFLFLDFYNINILSGMRLYSIAILICSFLIISDEALLYDLFAIFMSISKDCLSLLTIKFFYLYWNFSEYFLSLEQLALCSICDVQIFSLNHILNHIFYKWWYMSLERPVLPLCHSSF